MGDTARFVRVSLVLLMSLLAHDAAPQAAPIDVTGNWVGTARAPACPNVTWSWLANLTQSGTSVSGWFEATYIQGSQSFPVAGSLSGSTLYVAADYPGIPTSLTGTISGDVWWGTYTTLHPNALGCPSEPVTQGTFSGGRGGAIFADVPANYWARQWIHALYKRGVTGGCGTSPPAYCPETAVTREQMAVFLLKTLEGPAYAPPACTTPSFADVPCSSPFAPWVEELVTRGITAGCAPTSYCPSSSVSRAQMAVFLVTTFNLPL